MFAWQLAQKGALTHSLAAVWESKRESPPNWLLPPPVWHYGTTAPLGWPAVSLIALQSFADGEKGGEINK